jgi:dynein heavy chain
LYIPACLCRQENLIALERLENGLRKLNETNTLVDSMKAELAELAPVLAEKSAATAELVKQVAADQQEAEVVKRTVAAEEKEVKVQRGGCFGMWVLGCGDRLGIVVVVGG